MDDRVSSDELDHLEQAASLGYLLNAFSHELNNHLTNLLLGADQARMNGESAAVELMVTQAQKAGEAIAVLQRLGQSNVSRGVDRVDLRELCQRLVVWMSASCGAIDPAEVTGDSVTVMADRQNLLRALCNIARVGDESSTGRLEIAVGVERAPRSVWAPQGEEIEMAVVRLRRGDPPALVNAEFKELVDGFFTRDRSLEEVRLMAAWEVVRKLRGRLEMFGTVAGGGLEMVIKLPLASRES